MTSSRQILLIGMLGSLLGGCASWEPADSAPEGPVPDISQIPDAVPKLEPRSRYGNPDEYVVFGKTYRVMEVSKGFRETGIASWYGSKFHGARTSSGEAYDMYAMTAAHKSLPLPSYVRVTNLDNGKSVVVRVNDRGPFKDGRIIDLSYVAALKLDVVKHGTAPVEIVALEADAPPLARGAEEEVSLAVAPWEEDLDMAPIEPVAFGPAAEKPEAVASPTAPQVQATMTPPARVQADAGSDEPETVADEESSSFMSPLAGMATSVAGISVAAAETASSASVAAASTATKPVTIASNDEPPQDSAAATGTRPPAAGKPVAARPVVAETIAPLPETPKPVATEPELAVVSIPTIEDKPQAVIESPTIPEPVAKPGAAETVAARKPAPATATVEVPTERLVLAESTPAAVVAVPEREPPPATPAITRKRPPARPVINTDPVVAATTATVTEPESMAPPTQLEEPASLLPAEPTPEPEPVPVIVATSTPVVEDRPAPVIVAASTQAVVDVDKAAGKAKPVSSQPEPVMIAVATPEPAKSEAVTPPMIQPPIPEPRPEPVALAEQGAPPTPTPSAEAVVTPTKPASTPSPSAAMLAEAGMPELPPVTQTRVASTRPAVSRPSARPKPKVQPTSGNPAVTASANGSGEFYIQLGAFGNRSNAQLYSQELALAGFMPIGIYPEGALHRVRLGPLDRATAEKATERLIARGIEQFRVQEEPHR